VEYWFARLDHRSERFALFVLDALLVDGEVNDGCEVSDNLSSVLQADGDVVGVGHVGEKSHKINGVRLGETKTVLIVL